MIVNSEPRRVSRRLVWFESRGHGGRLELGVVARFGLGGRDVADGLEQAAVVEPVDPFEGGELDGFEASATARAGGSPRPCRGR